MSDNEEWIEAMKAKGHVPVMRDEEYGGGLDIFVMDAGYHNGPGCSSCGMSWCHHCDGPSTIEACSSPVIEMTLSTKTKRIAK